MWRWVTRGLVVSCLALLAPVLFAQQQFVGDVDAPDAGAVHSGMVLVKGWALDPGLISKIELWIDDQYQHNVVMNLPRIDVVEAFPDWPGIHNAKPGFITGFSANRFPNGAHTMELRVYTSDGQIHTVGRRTLTINNTVNQSPFGFLDIPDGKGVYNVSGAFPVLGWAADTDGIQTIEVLIDDLIHQSAMHGGQRPDVGATFPDYSGAMFSGWVANIDSTRLLNGVHTLAVRVTDTKGVSATIGRRTVQVINNALFLKPFGHLDEPRRDTTLYGTGCSDDDDVDEGPISPPIRPAEHLTPVRGWALDLSTRSELGRIGYAELLIDGVPWLSTDDCGVSAGRFSNCYGIPRYDVQQYYPTFPDSPLSGFLFTLDVGALLNLGVRPGLHNMRVRVGDLEQTFAEIPGRDGIPVWFQCVDNEFPFAGVGFVEFPGTYEYVGGTILVRGWALQAGPASTSRVTSVEIIVDGVFMGTAQYGYPRPDVGDFYSNITNADNSGWIFSLDTRKLSNARHRLTARAVSARGTKTEIGSVDFYVTNGSPQP